MSVLGTLVIFFIIVSLIAFFIPRQKSRHEQFENTLGIGSGNLKSCACCSGLISRNAKSCPHCGERNSRGTAIGSLKTLLLSIIGLFFILGVMVENTPRVAGNMSADNICATVGYAISSKLGKNIKTDFPCKVAVIRGNSVAIKSSYQTPFSNKKLDYIARVTVHDGSLVVDTIKVDGIDKKFVPFEDAF